MSITEDTVSSNVVEEEEKIDFEDRSETFYRLNRLNANLMERNYSLMMEKAELEKKYRELSGALNEIKKKNSKLVSELKHFRTPPHVVGEVLETLDEDRVLVKNGIGHYYVVKNLKEEGNSEMDELAVGKRVMMDYKNLNIVGVLPPSRDPIVSCAQVVERPLVTYDDIGGLEEQIDEVRETWNYGNSGREKNGSTGI